MVIYYFSVLNWNWIPAMSHLPHQILWLVHRMALRLYLLLMLKTYMYMICISMQNSPLLAKWLPWWIVRMCKIKTICSIQWGIFGYCVLKMYTHLRDYNTLDIAPLIWVYNWPCYSCTGPPVSWPSHQMR